jgi:hypothetical protein
VLAHQILETPMDKELRHVPEGKAFPREQGIYHVKSTHERTVDKEIVRSELGLLFVIACGRSSNASVISSSTEFVLYTIYLAHSFSVVSMKA